ncbi:bactofilin family protein [Gracilimonas sediminicola]|uniref:Polymer-forming cytoskeletal protein n=1 Tax=Gracilimonas sediminicola TaxID=2952158 RepID=A0A9X2L5I8_9BACT|nr:polymer-forming cytoskeletal protein [Gracilimonas sediminicola]MCP9292627.1 polymer-forming cytoskeletal protein [Gracilimonas sediminicola]
MLKRKSTPVKNTSNNNSNSKSGSAPSITYITKSTEITADMFCEDDVRIAGTVDGKIESKKKVMLTESGKVNGSIHSPDADISGSVSGDVKAFESLVLRASAIVDGKIFTKKLTIENGAQVKGSFQVGPNVSIPANGSQIVRKTGAGDKKKEETDT